MKIILYGKLEPDLLSTNAKYSYQEQPANYSNGSGRQIEWLSDKKFKRAENKFEKYMAKQRKKLKSWIAILLKEYQ